MCTPATSSAPEAAKVKQARQGIYAAATKQHACTGLHPLLTVKYRKQVMEEAGRHRRCPRAPAASCGAQDEREVISFSAPPIDATPSVLRGCASVVSRASTQHCPSPLEPLFLLYFLLAITTAIPPRPPTPYPVISRSAGGCARPLERVRRQHCGIYIYIYVFTFPSAGSLEAHALPSYLPTLRQS